MDVDFPDPDVERQPDGTFVAFATNSRGLKLQASTSPDLVSWTAPIDVLASLPTWAHPENPDLWAPTHIEHEGRHILLFSLRGARSGRHCIGAAESKALLGPYVPLKGEPVLCTPTVGGAIDPSVYVDSSGAFLLWKNDGNCCNMPTSLWSQPIDLASLVLSGAPSELLKVQPGWEQGVIEAPEFFKYKDELFLTYSGGAYASPGYAVGYARCAGPSGPCERGQPYPVLSTTAVASGPGGQSVFNSDDGLWIAYHAWSPDAVGYAFGGVRTMRIDPLLVRDGHLIVVGPTLGQQSHDPTR